MPDAQPARLSPRRPAESAVARPWRVLAIWVGLVVVGFLLTGGLLGSALSSEGDVTSNPESKRAEELIDERLPQRDEVDEVVIVSSREARVTDPDVRRRVTGLVEQLRGTGAVEQVFSYLDRGGEGLVSADGRATILQLVLAADEEDNIEDVIEIVQRADRGEGVSLSTRASSPPAATSRRSPPKI